MKNSNLFKAIVLFIQAHRKNKVFRGLMFTFASVTMFTTTYTLILPALTLEETFLEAPVRRSSFFAVLDSLLLPPLFQ